MSKRRTDTESQSAVIEEMDIDLDLDENDENEEEDPPDPNKSPVQQPVSISRQIRDEEHYALKIRSELKDLDKEYRSKKGKNYETIV